MAQVAERWGCTKPWVFSLIKRRKLAAEKIGGIWMIHVKDADRYVHQPGGRPSEGGTRAPKPPKRRRLRATAK